MTLPWGANTIALAMAEMSLFEAMQTQRAIRQFTAQVVPDEVITTILNAATRAPNGGNRQQWRFLVIRDPDIKRRLGEWYLEAWSTVVEALGPEASGQPYRSGRILAQNMAEVPVLILVCTDHGGDRPGPRPSHLTMGASIYPAVQNLMLAARALGLGTVLTTLHTHREQDVKELLGIPDSVETAALIPMGYPAEGQRFGGSRRKPVEEVTFYDRWGNTRSGG